MPGQVWNEAKPNEEVLAMVVRTGNCTSIGGMLWQILIPYKRLGLQDPFVKVGQQAVY